MDDRKIRLEKSMLEDQSNTVEDVCKALGVSRSTLHKYVGPGGTGPAIIGSGTENNEADRASREETSMKAKKLRHEYGH